MANENRGFKQVGEWQAYVKKNPQPDGLWWPLKFDTAGFADVARTHPAAFGVWREAVFGASEPDCWTYTVAIKAEARRGMTFKDDMREIKRRNIPDLLELRTYLLSLAN